MNDITQMTIGDLKALSYDNLAQIEQCQNNLRVLSQEIARRQEEPKQENKPKKG